jgi:hypothetical protein
MECVGRQEQDLSELLDKRAKEKEQRQARVMVRPSLTAASPTTPLAAPRAQDHFQTRHRPLNHLLGTPTGHHGRAVVPNESPFELRQKASDNANERTESRPSKRRKRDVTPPSKMGYAQSLFGATLSLSAVPVSSAPPRRPASSVYRPQSVTSSQEVEQNLRYAQEDRDCLVGAGSRASSMVEKEMVVQKEVVPPPKPLLGANRSIADEDNEKSGATAKSLDRARPVDAIQSHRQSTALQPTDANSRLSTSFGNGKLPAVSNKQTVNPPRSEKPATKRNRRLEPVTDQAEAVSDNHTTVVTDLGDSRSQAIVLNEVPHSGGDAEVQSFQRQEVPSSVSEPQRGAPRNSSKLSKRNKSLQSTTRPQPAKSKTAVAEDEAVDRSPNEERTELRLKPRQKRGLLLLSEKRDRPKQNKRQNTLASGPSLASKSPKPPTASKVTRTSPAVCLGTADVVSIAKQDNPFGSLPVAPEFLTLEPNPLQPPAQGYQDVPPEDDAGCEITDLTSCTGDAGSIEPGTKPVGQPDLDQSDSPKRPDHNITPSIHDRTANRSPSPPGRRVTSRGKGHAHVHNGPNRPSEFDPEETPTDLTQEPTIPEAPRRTRKANQDDQASGRLKKKARKGDSAGSGGEETPRPPVKPRLAKLSRKSIRSREVFGFVPSSPPVSNLANPVWPTVVAEVPNSAANNSTGSHEVMAFLGETSPVSDRTQPPMREAREAQTSSPQKVLPEATSPTLLGYDTVPGAASGGGVVEGPGNTKSEGCVSHPSISTPEKEAAVSTTTLGRASQKQPPESITPRPQLHENLLGLSEQPEWPMDGISNTGMGSGVAESITEHTSEGPTVGPTRPKIANPATRGRKAALKSDAAGQVPQSIVPVEPIPALRGVRPPAAPHPEPAASERPKRKMKFPGFASAKGGGPWSREAHDLLETARPGGSSAPFPPHGDI